MFGRKRKTTSDLSVIKTSIKIFPSTDNACEISFYKQMSDVEINEWLKKQFKTTPYWERLIRQERKKL